MIATASWEEVVVTLLGLAALLYNCINWHASHLGVMWVKARAHVLGADYPDYLIVARQFRRNDLARALKQLGFLMIWVLALAAPNAVGGGATARAYVIRAIFIGMQVWLVWGGVLDKRDREGVQARARTRHTHGHGYGHTHGQGSAADENYDPHTHTGDVGEWDRHDEHTRPHDAASIVNEALGRDMEAEREGEKA